VTLAVLVSGWAHVLHAVYKPWGAGSAMYTLQHGSLFVTSFVFLMGLLFKVQVFRKVVPPRWWPWALLHANASPAQSAQQRRLYWQYCEPEQRCLAAKG
jgi:hypothetical protein